jgi:hypothetical protein
MPTQYQIEQAAGITDEPIAKHIMSRSTQASKSAYSLLKMQCSFYEPSGFSLLKEAVAECRQEMEHPK